MKILSIGNSFSQDAHKWLSQIAKAYGDEITAVNLYIGGCSLETHWNNFTADAAYYNLEINGEFSKKSTISEALKSVEWDIITFQQASYSSGEYESYQPYLENLYNEAKSISPDSKFYIHQTWSYEIDSDHNGFARYNNDQKQMYAALTDAYLTAADKINCDIIPSGKIIQYLRENCKEFDYNNGGLSLNRDGFHLSYIYGRYAAGLTWYAYLTKKNIKEVKFIPTYDGKTADKDLLQVINNAVDYLINDGI